MKERQKMARQQERYHRQMQLRVERELRSRQITEVLLTYALPKSNLKWLAFFC